MIPHIHSKNEIENIIKQTRNFINEHLIYYNKAIQYLICKQKIIDIKHLKKCSFDNYMRSLENFILKEEQNKLIKTHDLFHLQINTILSIYLNTKPVSYKLFNTLYTTHIKFINLLNDIILKFDYARNSLDSLTGAWEREIFLNYLEIEYSEMRRGKTPFSLVFLDVDFFKTINDKYSHDTGDYILKELVKIVQISLREYDSISRWGGDEFLILLPNTLLNDAVMITERIKMIIDNHTFLYNSLELKVSCSFGVSEASINQSISEIINTTDKLLYKSKKAGRNKIKI